MLTDDRAPQEKTVQQIIEDQVRVLLLDDDQLPQEISSDQLLAEIGLNSLMLAQLLIHLESELGVDPFGEELSIADIHTVGELAAAYQRATTVAGRV